MWISVGCINLATAVLLGAFGAHAVKGKIPHEHFALWQTATDYFFYHALGIVIIGVLIRLNHISSNIPNALLQSGIVFFCGSLYLMALGFPKWIALCTPIGGLLFVFGWLYTALLAYKTYQK